MPSLPDLHQLEIFARVIDEQSVSRGARALGLAQPTASEHLASLERSLGVRLFDRVARQIRPTRAGRVLYRYALELLRTRREALSAIGSLRGLAGGSLDVGGSNIPGVYVLPRAIRAFQQSHPSVQLALRVGSSAQILEAVASGDCELGVVGARPPKGAFLARPLGEDHLRLVVAPGHAFADRKRVSFEDLRGDRYLARERGSGTRALIEKVCEAHGVAAPGLPVAAELGSNEAVKQAVIAGLGYSFLSERSIEHEIECGLLKTVPVAAGEFTRPFYLVGDRRRAASPIRREFEKHLGAVFAPR